MGGCVRGPLGPDKGTASWVASSGKAFALWLFGWIVGLYNFLGTSGCSIGGTKLKVCAEGSTATKFGGVLKSIKLADLTLWTQQALPFFQRAHGSGHFGAGGK